MFFLKLGSQSRKANGEQELAENNNTGIKVAHIYIHPEHDTVTHFQYKQ